MRCHFSFVPGHAVSGNKTNSAPKLGFHPGLHFSQSQSNGGQSQHEGIEITTLHSVVLKREFCSDKLAYPKPFLPVILCQ